MYEKEKEKFFESLKTFTDSLSSKLIHDNQWTIRGFIDIFKNIYSLTTDSKVLSKILELHLLPELLSFSEVIDYKIEPAEKQNWYPDFTFISNKNNDIKFAVDLKTTYRNEKRPDFCNGFTLGSHGEYFSNRNSAKNIQYPYSHYFCIGIIYSRNILQSYDVKTYSIDSIENIPAIGDFLKRLIIL